MLFLLMIGFAFIDAVFSLRAVHRIRLIHVHGREDLKARVIER